MKFPKSTVGESKILVPDERTVVGSMRSNITAISALIWTFQFFNIWSLLHKCECRYVGVGSTHLFRSNHQLISQTCLS